jgi:hypothetical protein
MNSDEITHIMRYVPSSTIIHVLSLLNCQWYECSKSHKLWKARVRQDPRFEGLTLSLDYRKLCQLFCPVPIYVEDPTEETVFLDFLGNLKKTVEKLEGTPMHTRISLLDTILKDTNLIKNRLQTNFESFSVLSQLNTKVSNLLVRHIEFNLSKGKKISTLKSKFVIFSNGHLITLSMSFQEDVRQDRPEEFEDDYEISQKIEGILKVDDQLLKNPEVRPPIRLFEHEMCLPAKSELVNLLQSLEVDVVGFWTIVSTQILDVLKHARFLSDTMEDPTESISRKIRREMKRMKFNEEAILVDSSSEDSSSEDSESNPSNDSFIDDVEELPPQKKPKLIKRVIRRTTTVSTSREVFPIDTDDEIGEELESDAEELSQNNEDEDEYLKNDSFINDEHAPVHVEDETFLSDENEEEEGDHMLDPDAHRSDREENEEGSDNSVEETVAPTRIHKTTPVIKRRRHHK